MIKKSLVLLSFLLVALLIVYYSPTASPPFDEIYQKVDQDTKESLKRFRQEYPVKQFAFGDHVWNYIAVGQGDESILFPHGMTGAYDIWWQQVLEFQKNYKVNSLTYPPVEHLEEKAQAIAALLKAEDIQSIHVVGSSLGGYLLQYLLLHRPELIKKAILANTIPCNEERINKDRKAGRFLPIAPEWLLMHVMRKRTVSAVVPAAGYSELVQAFIFEQTHGRMTKEHFQARLASVIESFATPDLDTLGIPVLILNVDNDPLIESKFRNLMKTLYPSANVKTLKGVGHFSYLNEPDLYNRVIRDFFFGGN